MEAIIVAVITAVGTTINTVISKKTNKKVETVAEVKQELKEHIQDSDKTYLTNFLSELKAGVPKTEIQKKRAYEIYDRYTKNKGNSYVHDEWEDCRKIGLL